MEYLPRIADQILDSKLQYAGAVCIRGPKWCGKTSTAEQMAHSAVYLQDPDELENNIMLAETKPSLLLRGDKPRLIDEWQDAPKLWDAVRYAVDRGQEVGAYILTGSVVPGEKPRHSGTGRFSYLDMRPMSLFESRESTGEVSLRQLFEAGNEPEGYSAADIEDMAFMVCRGGWPRAVTIGGMPALNVAKDYLAALCEEDISRVDGVGRNPQHARSIMAEYARCVSTMATLNTIRSDLSKRGSEFSKDLVNSYIAAVRKLYAIEDLGAWSPSLHAKSRVSKRPARFFVDPSIAAAALGASPQMLLRDVSTLGMLYENLCIRDLRIYAEAIGGMVLRYHDSTGLETDAVITLDDGRYGLIEMKLGASFVDAGAETLLKLANKLNTSIMGRPSFLAVVTPGGYAFRRPDGVCVLPIACLGA